MGQADDAYGREFARQQIISFNMSEEA